MATGSRWLGKCSTRALNDTNSEDLSRSGSNLRLLLPRRRMRTRRSSFWHVPRLRRQRRTIRHPCRVLGAVLLTRQRPPLASPERVNDEAAPEDRQEVTNDESARQISCASRFRNGDKPVAALHGDRQTGVNDEDF